MPDPVGFPSQVFSGIQKTLRHAEMLFRRLWVGRVSNLSAAWDVPYINELFVERAENITLSTGDLARYRDFCLLFLDRWFRSFTRTGSIFARLSLARSGLVSGGLLLETCLSLKAFALFFNFLLLSAGDSFLRGLLSGFVTLTLVIRVTGCQKDAAEGGKCR